MLKDDEKKDIEYSFCDISKLTTYVIKDFDVKRRFFFYIFQRKCESLKIYIFSLYQNVNSFTSKLFILKQVSLREGKVLQKFANSYLFNIAYNFDSVFKVVY